MVIYLFLYIAIILVGFYTDKEIMSINNKTIINPNFYVFTFIFFLFLLSAARVDIGTDYYFYNLIYKYALEEHLELGIGFEWISNLFRIFELDYQLFIASNSLIVLLSIIFLTLNYSKYHYLSIITFLGTYAFFSSFNIFRQFTSIALVIIALVLFNKYKNKLLSISIYIFSIGIHLSSIVYLPAFLMRYIQVSKKVYFIILALCPLSYFIIPESLKELVFNELMNLNTFYADKYISSVYIESEGRSIANKFFYLFYWFFTFNLIWNTDKIDKNERWLVQGFILYLLLESMLPYSNLSQRVSYFFELLSIYIIPKSISTMENIIYRNIVKIAVILIFFVRVFYVLNLNGDGVVPYTSIFSQ